MINLIIYGTWLIFSIFMPDIIYGWSYPDLIKIFLDKDSKTATEILKALNLTKENSSQWAGKKIFTCVLISVITLLIIVVVFKLLEKLNKTPSNKSKQSTTNKITTQQQNEKYTHSIKYLNIEHYPNKIIANIEFNNKYQMTKITTKYEEFSIMINNLPISSTGIENSSNKKSLIIKENSSKIIKVSFNVNLKDTKADLKILYKGNEIKLGSLYKYNKEVLLKD